MVKIEKYTGAKTYMYPNGALATPDVIEKDFSAVKTFTHIVETDEAGQVCFAVQNLAAVRSQLGIDSSLSEDEAIVKIEELRNAPIPEADPTAEERIAATLEMQTLLAMDDMV